MVGVAERRRAGAAAGDAAEVAIGQRPALRGGDLVGQGFQADDLAGTVGQDPGDPGVAQHGFDPGSGLRSGSRGAGTGLRALLKVPSSSAVTMSARGAAAWRAA